MTTPTNGALASGTRAVVKKSVENRGVREATCHFRHELS